MEQRTHDDRQPREGEDELLELGEDQLDADAYIASLREQVASAADRAAQAEARLSIRRRQVEVLRRKVATLEQAVDALAASMHGPDAPDVPDPDGPDGGPSVTHDPAGSTLDPDDEPEDHGGGQADETGGPAESGTDGEAQGG